MTCSKRSIAVSSRFRVRFFLYYRKSGGKDSVFFKCLQQQLQQLVIPVYRVRRLNLRLSRTRGTIPARVDARVDAARDVRGERIPDHQVFLARGVAIVREDRLVIRSARLLHAHLLRDEHPAEQRQKAGFCEPRALHKRQPVGRNRELVVLRQRLERLHRAREQDRLLAKVFDVARVHADALRGVAAEVLGIILKADALHAFTVQLARFKSRPCRAVDLKILLIVRFGDGYPHLLHRLKQRGFFARGEVHQRVVDVKEQVFIFPGFCVQCLIQPLRVVMVGIRVLQDGGWGKGVMVY